MHEWTKEEANIIKAAWATDHGRLAINLVVERLAGLMSPAFDPSPTVAAWKEGRRSVGIDLMRVINTPTDKLFKEPDEPRRRSLTATERANLTARGDLASTRRFDAD